MFYSSPETHPQVMLIAEVCSLLNIKWFCLAVKICLQNKMLIIQSILIIDELIYQNKKDIWIVNISFTIKFYISSNSDEF